MSAGETCLPGARGEGSSRPPAGQPPAGGEKEARGSGIPSRQGGEGVCDITALEL